MEVVFDEKIIQKGLVTKDDISHLPTKEEYAKGQDEILGELQSLREAVDIVTSYKDQIEDHESRIGEIENKLELSPA